MHIQSQYNESRAEVLQELIRSYPLATFVVHSDELIVNHFPLVFVGEGEHGVLKGHIPRANTLWKALEAGQQAIAIFQGPEAYVSPSWYPSKHEHGKAVPTWNYAVVHAHGTPTVVHDSDWLLQHLNELTDQQEAAQDIPWRVSDAPADYTQKMLSGIVGIEMPITAIAGKWKLSQNKSAADRLGVAAGLRNRGTSDALALDEMMQAGAAGSDPQ